MTRTIQRRLLALAGVVVALLGVIYIAWPVGHVPPYDANLVRLAESDLQGYCAGETFWKSGGAGSANMASACRKRLAKQRANTPNLGVAQGAFCAAIVDSGWQGTRKDCLTIMDQNQYWPTYDGSITNQWNHARPYPRLIISVGPGAKSGGSRTGGHSGSDRTNNPTHDVPIYP